MADILEQAPLPPPIAPTTMKKKWSRYYIVISTTQPHEIGSDKATTLMEKYNEVFDSLFVNPTDGMEFINFLTGRKEDIDIYNTERLSEQGLYSTISTLRAVISIHHMARIQMKFDNIKQAFVTALGEANVFFKHWTHQDAGSSLQDYMNEHRKGLATALQKVGAYSMNTEGDHYVGMRDTKHHSSIPFSGPAQAPISIQVAPPTTPQVQVQAQAQPIKKKPAAAPPKAEPAKPDTTRNVLMESVILQNPVRPKPKPKHKHKPIVVSDSESDSSSEEDEPIKKKVSAAPFRWI